MGSAEQQPRAWPADAPSLSPGEGVRFCVIDSRDGARSAVWRVWTAKNSDDVYLLELHTGPTWKVSHHNEGDVWRIAMTKEGAAALGTKRVAVDHWERVAASHGWREGVGVLAPVAYLRPQAEQLSPKVRQIPVSPTHDAVQIRLLFEEPGSVGQRFPAAFPVAVLHSSTGGRVYVLAEPTILGSSATSALEELCAEARASREASDSVVGSRFVAVVKMREQRVLADLTAD